MFNCCCEPCKIYEDLFATDSLLSSWSETVGAWSITGGVLQTSDADAILIANKEHPDGENQAQVTKASIRMAAALDRARIIVAWQDLDDYLFAELWINSGCIHVQLYERSGGTVTAIGDEVAAPFIASTSTFYPATLCYVPGDDARLTLTLSNSFDPVWTTDAEVTGTHSGKRGGVGTGDPVDNTIRFDNFSYQRYYDATNRPTCPQCDRTYSSCQLLSDTFFRSDSTDIGCAWEEVAGNWSISSNKLVVASDGALAIHRGKHPDKNSNLHFTFSVNVEAGGVALLIVDYTDDQNYFFVKIEPGSHGLSGQISFWRKEGGSDTQIGTTSRFCQMPSGLTYNHLFAFCWEDERVFLYKYPLSGTDDKPSTHGALGAVQMADDPRYGFGTGSASEVRFDDVLVKRLLTPGLFGCETCGVVDCNLYHNDPRQLGTNTTPNGMWDTVSGTWGYNDTTTAESRYVGGFEDLKTSSSNAMIINGTGHPGTTVVDKLVDLTCKFSCDISTFDYANVARAIIGWQDDENYLFAEVQFGDSGDTEFGFLRVGKVVGGGETVLGETQLSVRGSKPNLDVGLGNGQNNSTLSVCYDGLMIRASWENNSMVFDTDSSSPSFELATAFGNAGTGWNPGRFGVATGTMAAGTLVFGNFIYRHDLDWCGSCGTTEPRCHLCYTLDGPEMVDKTPDAMLVKIEGLVSSGGTPDCSNSVDFNDTFVLPFFDESLNVCSWAIRPRICPHPLSAITDDNLFLEIEHWTNNVDVGFKFTVTLTQWSDIYPSPSPPTSATVVWEKIVLSTAIPSYFIDTARGTRPVMDCIEFLDDWLVIDGFVTDSGWLSSADSTSTVSIKIP